MTQVQYSSMGEKSFAKAALRIFRVPEETMALPKRWFLSVKDWLETGYERLTAVRDGHTQSNMSAPRAIETIRSSGYP
jgi:hypothetical protein